MSTTSTNKQPLLMDRPWANGVNLSSKFIPSLTAINTANMELLLDGTVAGFDGAFVDTVQCVGHSNAKHEIALFLAFNTSVQTKDTVIPVAISTFTGVPEGVIVTMELPEVCVPVPMVPTGAAGDPGSGKNHGLWVPRGVQLWVARIAGAQDLTGVQVVALGGLY